MFSRDQITAIVLTLFVWGFAGGLFGALFAGLYQVLGILGLTSWQPIIVAATVAAMTTSAFYSAMPVALLGAAAGVVASIGYLIVIDQEFDLVTIVSAAGMVGIIAGSGYAWMVREDSRPLAETLTGLIAGLLAGGCLAGLLEITGRPFGMFVLAAGVVAVVGTVFQLSERWLVTHSSIWLPQMLSAPLVAGMVSAVVGASIWVLGGTTGTLTETNAGDVVSQIIHQIPAGLLGGLLGGAVTGVVLELLGFHLEDHL